MRPSGDAVGSTAMAAIGYKHVPGSTVPLIAI